MSSHAVAKTKPLQQSRAVRFSQRKRKFGKGSITFESDGVLVLVGRIGSV